MHCADCATRNASLREEKQNACRVCPPRCLGQLHRSIANLLLGVNLAARTICPHRISSTDAREPRKSEERQRDEPGRVHDPPSLAEQRASGAPSNR
eukprot:2019681-Alexandrium_andersonii.AAC.1